MSDTRRSALARLLHAPFAYFAALPASTQVALVGLIYLIIDHLLRR